MNLSDAAEIELRSLMEELWEHAPPEIEIGDVDGRAGFEVGWFESYLDYGANMTRDHLERLLLVLRPSRARKAAARALLAIAEKDRAKRARFFRDVARHGRALDWVIGPEYLSGRAFAGQREATLTLAPDFTKDFFRACLNLGRFRLTAEAGSVSEVLVAIWEAAYKTGLAAMDVASQISPKEGSEDLVGSFPCLRWGSQGDLFSEGEPLVSGLLPWKIYVLRCHHRPLQREDVAPFYQASIVGLGLVFGHVEGATPREAVMRARERLLGDAEPLLVLANQKPSARRP